MDTENLVIDHDAEGKEIEHVREVMPDVGVAVFSCAFGVETVGLGDASRLVVATDEMNAVGVS